MFTGLVQAIGKVVAVDKRSDDMRIRVQCGTIDGLHTGDSVSVNGVCLTITDVEENTLWMDVSSETLMCTTFSQLKPNTEINLETCLTPSSFIGGHLVSGHIDCVGKVTEMCEDGRSVKLSICIPKDYVKYIVEKGSVCVDGVSLTVNSVHNDIFQVNIIPHTLEETVIKHYQPGAQVNVEVDLLARYVERLITAGTSAEDEATNGVTIEFLQRYGFIKSSGS